MILSSSVNGIISQVNMVLKNGLLIEILFSFSCLCINGSSVFSNIISIVVISKILFVNSKDFCDYSVLFMCEWILCLCVVNSSSELLIISIIKVRINILCVGLDVNVCIDISMLECMRKVFNRYNEKVLIVSSNVYVLKLVCCLVIVSECISVVFISYGINEVFFIGF